MTRYLLDTNIVSNATKVTPSRSLVDWLSEQLDQDLLISTISIAEIRRGILVKQDGRKRRELDAWFSGPEGPQALFAGRVLPFDERAALAWAGIMVEGATLGRPRSALDTIVAAIAVVHDCIVVTDNEKHFSGIEIFNPMRRDRPKSPRGSL